MTSLFDATVQHNGWQLPNFADAGWVDSSTPLVTGLVPQSFWVSPLNRQDLDVQLAIQPSQPTSSSQWFFIRHIADAAQGLITNHPGVVLPNDRLWIYTRVPQSNQVIAMRAVVSELATTPPPTSPP